MKINGILSKKHLTKRQKRYSIVGSKGKKKKEGETG